MSLRFFSDPCVPAEITDTLRRHGHQVTLLRDVLPIRSLDVSRLKLPRIQTRE